MLEHNSPSAQFYHFLQVLFTIFPVALAVLLAMNLPAQPLSSQKSFLCRSLFSSILLESTTRHTSKQNQLSNPFSITWKAFQHFPKEVTEVQLDFLESRRIFVWLALQILTSTLDVVHERWVQAWRVSIEHTLAVWMLTMDVITISMVLENTYLMPNVPCSATSSNTFTSCSRRASRRRLRLIFSCFLSTASRT